MGQPSLLFTGNIEEILSARELNVLLYSALLKIRQGEAKVATAVSLLLGIFYLPVSIFQKFVEFCHRNLHTRIFAYPLKALDLLLGSLQYFYYPLEMVKVTLFKSRKNVINFDRLVSQNLSNKKDLASALFKLNEQEQGNADILSELFENFSVAQNKRTGALPLLLDLGISPQERYLALS